MWFTDTSDPSTIAVLLVRTLPPDEAFAVFTEWTRRQHWFAELMLGQIGLSWDVPPAQQRAIVAGFPFVGLRLVDMAGVPRH